MKALYQYIWMNILNKNEDKEKSLIKNLDRTIVISTVSYFNEYYYRIFFRRKLLTNIFVHNNNFVTIK